MILPSKSTFVFDLDDTLYSERDFEKSGIRFVYENLRIDHVSLETLLNNRNNWINLVVNSSKNQFSWRMVLELYRNHSPTIKLFSDAKFFLEKLLSKGIEMSIVTDGRSITQRNKLKALGIESFFKNVVISEEVNSEKPSENNYRMVMCDNSEKSYIYIGDNPKKDFITPNKLGWVSICLLDRGQNVHEQVITNSIESKPQFVIKSFNEIDIENF
jgi:putative hydrolase of the HAD superfamily